MYIFKNALRCIGRAKGRSILIGIISLVIAVSACIGLSIRQAAQSAKADALSGMSVSATIAVDRQGMMGNFGSIGGFDKESFSQMLGNASALTLEEYLKYSEAESVKDFYYSLTVSMNGGDGTEPVESDTSNRPDMGGNPFGELGGRSSADFSIVGYSSEKGMTAFINGTASITEGVVFTEGTSEYECIISEELAVYNGLSVGSAITLSNPNKSDEIYTFNVVGIYSDTSANESFQMFSGTDPANSIYMSYTALSDMLSSSEALSSDTKLAGSISATYLFESPDDYYLFEDEVRVLGLSDDYSVSSQDLSAFESSLVPLNTLGTMAMWFLIIILIIGGIILVVLNIFSIRERKYELGVLMAIGMKKSRIALQFMTEVFVITVSAVIIGIIIGAVTSVPVTNALLANQIESSSAQADRIEDGFGRGDMPGFGGDMGGNMQLPGGGRFDGIGNIFGENAANYINEIDSAMNLTVVFQMLGIAVLLTLLAGAASVLFIMRYEPLKILSNRD